jgi:hypothetical protein
VIDSIFSDVQEIYLVQDHVVTSLGLKNIINCSLGLVTKLVSVEVPVTIRLFAESNVKPWIYVSP